MINSVRNALLICIATMLALSAAEMVSRFILPPVDFLLPRMEAHDTLNHRISAFSAGHDALGFRNPAVPEHAAVVAIGDSMTYGVAASHRDAWPRQLERLINKSVYNLALGGYGPVHYLHLLTEIALPLEPDLVIVGFYFGNDLMDAYNLVYGHEAWRHLRGESVETVGFADELIGLAGPTKRFGALRNWLAQNSVIYRVITQSPIANPVRRAEIAQSHADVLHLEIPGGATFLTPGHRFAALDEQDPKVQEGLALTLRAFEEIQRHCDGAGTRLLVLLIPTKENVYRDLVIDRELDIEGSALLDLVSTEERVKLELIGHLDALGVPHLDLLEPLRSGAAVASIFPENDGHPNALGYSIIAAEVAQWIDAHDVFHR